MDQIERIMKMEQCLDASEKAIRELSEALSAFEEVQAQYRQLSGYYGSDQWIEDYEDDEAGKLPKDLKRGVLSEDGIWNMLEDHRNLKARVEECLRLEII